MAQNTETASAKASQKDFEATIESGNTTAENSYQHEEERPVDLPKDPFTNDGNGRVDGGFDAWLVCAGGWCCSLVSPGWVNCVGTFQEYYEVGPLRTYPAGTIAWIPALQIFFLFALGPLVGILYDRYGPRILIIVGTFLHVFGLMMASLATRYYEFLLSQGVCSAIGVAFIYTPAISSLATWFVKWRGFAMGVMVTGSSIGGVVFPIMISRMITEVGYPWAMRTAAFLILGVQIFAIITVRPRTKPIPRKVSLKGYITPFAEYPFAMLLLGLFFLTFGIYLPVQYMALSGYAVAKMPEQLAQNLIPIFNAASLFGRLIPGYIADKIGRWNTFVFACTFCGVSELAVWLIAKSSARMIGFAVFFGFMSGAFTSLSGALPISVSPADEIGYRIGLTYLAFSIPGLVLGVIGGAIIDSSSFGWSGMIIFGGLTCFVGSAITMYSRWLYTDKHLFNIF